MDLTIIIAQYDPGDHPSCIESFHKTLSQIESQKENYEIEVIIADDGSVTHQDIQSFGSSRTSPDDKTIYQLEGNSLANWTQENYFDYPSISHWLYLPKIEPMMSKARVGNFAIAKASSSNLFFLDDDNYFISNHTIESIIKLLQKYQLVIGQIQDNNGRLRSYSSKRVQGTTFGIIKHHIVQAGLFGVWTEQVSCGIDSDLWWKLYHHFQKNPHLQACYSPDIITLDSCSKRWKPYINTFFRNYALKNLFKEIHGCKNYRSINTNPSRNKPNWIIDLT